MIATRMVTIMIATRMVTIMITKTMVMIRVTMKRDMITLSRTKDTHRQRTMKMIMRMAMNTLMEMSRFCCFPTRSRKIFVKNEAFEEAAAAAVVVRMINRIGLTTLMPCNEL
eukprot:4364113-Pleurochrysis_carterae.AAC.15